MVLAGNPFSHNVRLMLMLGELVYSGKGKVTAQKVIDTEPAGVETSFSEIGKLRDLEVTNMGTYVSSGRDDGAMDGGGKGIAMTKDGEVITWTGKGIGRFTGAGSMSWRGALFFHTQSKGKAAFANNMVGMFEYEIDAMGNQTGRVWEWK